MSVPHGGVVVVQPAKQHAYQVAIALQRAGRLRQFLTGVYFTPATFPYSLVPLLPPPVRNRVLRELGKRTSPDLSPDLVHSWPYAEALSRTIGRTRWVVTVSHGASGTPFIERATDWRT